MQCTDSSLHAIELSFISLNRDAAPPQAKSSESSRTCPREQVKNNVSTATVVPYQIRQQAQRLLCLIQDVLVHVPVVAPHSRRHEDVDPALSLGKVPHAHIPDTILTMVRYEYTLSSVRVSDARKRA